MRIPSLTRLLCATSLAAAACSAQAITFNDASGDYVAGYAGSRLGDLDVLSAAVTYNPSTDVFVFTGTLAADIGRSRGGFYVFGLDRGAGTARFAANGVGGVLFDSVVIFNQDGSGTVNRLVGAAAGATPLAAGTALTAGSSFVGQVSGSLLPSLGLAKTAYTWNLWPRDGTLAAGFGQISDFAPDNSNVLVTTVGAVPEPATGLLLALGLAGLVLRRAGRGGPA